MILTGAILLGLLALWLALAAVETFRLGIGFPAGLALCPVQARLPHRRFRDPRRRQDAGAGHLRDLAPVAARPGADAVAAARTDAAHPRRGIRRNRSGSSRGASLPAPSPSTPSMSSSAGGWCACSRARGGSPSISPTASSPTPSRSGCFAPSRASRSRPTPRSCRSSSTARALPALLADAARARAAPLVPEAVDHRARADDDRRTHRASRRTVRRPPQSNALFDRARRGAARRRRPRPQPVRRRARRRRPLRPVAHDRRGRRHRRADLPQAAHRRARARPALRRDDASPARLSACSCPTPTASCCRCSALRRPAA